MESGSSESVLPNQLSALVPTFDPSTDNVEIWASKVELLLSAWPEAKIKELATRLVLGCKGTAYQKLQLRRDEIIVNDPKGIQLIVELVGGTWGQIPLEKKFELVEKALFRSVQKADESSDSFLSRCDVIWSDLLSRKLDMDEVRSYITLRGSRLTPDDKKRVIIESGAEKGSKLEMSKVTAAIRMLGSGFFQDLTGSKRDKGLKTYDHTAFVAEDPMEEDHETYWTEDLDDSTLEQMAADEDDDAALVLQFEDAVSELAQNDAELSAFYSAYQDARRRLTDKVKFRGFWSVKRGEKGPGKKGKVKGKGKGGRNNLASRIANSFCRICWRQGHWKNECPNNPNASKSAGPSNPSPAPAQVPVSFAATTEVPSELQHLTLSEDGISDVYMAWTGNEKITYPKKSLGNVRIKNQLVNVATKFQSKMSIKDMVHALRRRQTSERPRKTEVSGTDFSGTGPKPVQFAESQPDLVDIDVGAEQLGLFASSGATGVVDLGASQTVIGSAQVSELLSELPPWIRDQVKRKACNLIFRFGNHQTLVSKHALVLPLNGSTFQIAVVPGPTPFLISSSFLKGIKAVIDTDEETLWSKKLERHLKIHRNHKNLFLLDLNELWKSPSTAAQIQRSRPVPESTCYASEVKQAPDSQGPEELCHTPDKHEKPNNHNQDKHAVVRVSTDPMTAEPTDVSAEKSSNATLADSLIDHSNGDLVSEAAEVSCRSESKGREATASRPGETDVERSREGEDRVRTCQTGSEIPRSFSGRKVDGLVLSTVRNLWKGAAPEVHPLRVTETGSGDQRREGEISIQDQRHDGLHSDASSIIGTGVDALQGGAWSRERSISPSGRCLLHPCEPDGRSNGPSVPTGRANGDDAAGVPEHPASHDADRDGPAGDNRHAQDQGREPLTEPKSEGSYLAASDQVEHDTDFIYHVPQESEAKSFQKQVQKMVQTFRNEFNNIKQIQSTIRCRLDLLEVMCHSQSELTNQVLRLGGSAVRFGLDQGDLSTKEGRRMLFQTMIKHRPKDLWYSPECRPWCLWNQYNSQKNAELFQKIFQDRMDNLWQLSLGIVLHEIQVSNGSHFHMEQPQGALSWKVPGMQAITETTHRCCFDLCNVGQLQDPETGIPIRKRLNVQTSSAELHRALHGRWCNRTHEHRQIAGSLRVAEDSPKIPVTKYIEMYPRKFARQIAKIVLQSKDKPRTSNIHNSFPAEAEPEVKRRRLNGKLSPEAIQRLHQSINWQTVMQLANRTAPRVGTMVVEHGDLFNQVQHMCPNHDIQHLVLCRGTDRAVGPNKRLEKGSAPLRKMVCIRRKFEDIHEDEEWEPWEHLTFKGLRRKTVSARLNMTIFASAKYQPVPPPVAETRSSADAPIRRLSSDTAELDPRPNKIARVTAQDENSGSEVTEPKSTSESTGIDQQEIRQTIDLVSMKHGPMFQALSQEEQAWLLKIHRNMGHPGSQKLETFCRQLQCPNRILQAIPDLRCSTCVETTMPKIARPSAIPEHTDFGDVISMDGVVWTNNMGEQFKFYHFVDQSTSFQTAVLSGTSSEDAINALLQGWMLWAGAPKLLCVDQASELNSEEFLSFLQKNNICLRTCAANAHWQNSRAERHGGILQLMLNKMDQEENIRNPNQLQKALIQATTTKNQWSRYRGFPPEILVFGRGARIPGSVTSDPNTAAHHQALSQMPDGQRFREELSVRERARRAFAAVDNDQRLRRALVSRSCPNRGIYQQGQWVMLWKKRGEREGVWEGPMQVISQEANRVVWISRGNKLFRAAPEHVRPLSAVEEWKVDLKGIQNDNNPHSIVPPHGGVQYHNLSQHSTPTTDNQSLNNPESIPFPTNPEAEVSPENNQPNQEETRERSPVDQPDNEPDISRQLSALDPGESESREVEPDPASIPVPNETDDDAELICEMLMAEVDHECFALDTEHAWKFEIEVSQADIENWRREDRPWEMAFVVSAAKKQRSEVRMSQLNAEEKELFQNAKMKEIDSWLSTETVARVLRHQIPESNILRCRWILTWKPVDEPSSESGKDHHPRHVPKARLVVLGYEDPMVHEIPRDSPTMTKLSRMLILQLAASQKWDIESFDIKTAFLRGSENGQRVLGIEPTSELREKMKLKPQEILQLLKGAYGRVDAPYLWFCELKKGLEALGFVAAPFCPCTFVLPNPITKVTEGIVGVHVDDGLCCGSPYFQQKLQELAKKFPFGSHKKQNFTFTGLKIEQKPDYSIWVNQSQYVKDITPINLTRERKNQLEDVVNEKERQSLRAVVGSLQYAAVNSRPDLCSRLGWLQSNINKAKVSTLVEANRILHEAKMHSDVAIHVQSIPLADLRFVAFSDASFASAKNPDSHQGMVIMSCHKNIADNRPGAVNPLLWHSKKIQKVAVSTLSAESMALSGSVDVLSWVRLYWGWILNVNLPWKQADATLLTLPPAFAAIPPTSEEEYFQNTTPHEDVQKLVKQLPKEHESIITTDCKSLYDLVSRTAPPSCSEFRTLLQAKLIKEHIHNGIQIRWVPSAAQIADALTKVMDNTILRECLKLGKYCLHDEKEILKARSDSRARLQWMRDHAPNAGKDD